MHKHEKDMSTAESTSDVALQLTPEKRNPRGREVTSHKWLQPRVAKADLGRNMLQKQSKNYEHTYASPLEADQRAQESTAAQDASVHDINRTT